MKIIESRGRIDIPLTKNTNSFVDYDFYLPPFEIEKGELVHFYVRPNYWEVIKALEPIFTGKLVYPNVTVSDSICYAGADYFRHPILKRFLSGKCRLVKLTVSEYIDKNINLNRVGASSFDEIYEHPDLKETDITRLKFGELPNDVSRLLKIYTCLSTADNVILNYIGLSPISKDYIWSKLYPLALEKKYTIIDFDDFLDVENTYDRHIELKHTEI